MLHDHDGTLLDIGRRHRKPTAAQRRAVRERDHYRCAFPGCQSRRTDLHHIRHWAHGGTTSYWNLISLCELCRRRHNSHYADLRIMSC
jgi:5-methylcytosine-specific restriction endonuclease McrA